MTHREEKEEEEEWSVMHEGRERPATPRVVTGAAGTSEG